MMRNAVHTPESHAESTTYDSAKPESGYTKSLALSNDPPPMQLLELQKCCRVHELHLHGVGADLEAHELAIAGPQAECHTLIIRNHLHVTGGQCSCS